jgi:hypothetical protein
MRQPASPPNWSADVNVEQAPWMASIGIAERMLRARLSAIDPPENPAPRWSGAGTIGVPTRPAAPDEIHRGEVNLEPRAISRPPKPGIAVADSEFKVRRTRPMTSHVRNTTRPYPPFRPGRTNSMSNASARSNRADCSSRLLGSSRRTRRRLPTAGLDPHGVHRSDLAEHQCRYGSTWQGITDEPREVRRALRPTEKCY